MSRKMQTAGIPQIERSIESHNTLIYSAVAIGVVLGATASAYWWRGRARALKLLKATPFERVEDLISSCESKIEDIERTMEELKKSKG